MERDNRGRWWKISTVGSFLRAHDCNGDKTADSSGGCDFIESIVAPQYRLHLDIIYCTFKEKWLWMLFLKWEDCLGNLIKSKHFRFFYFFHALNNLLEKFGVFRLSYVFSPCRR